MRGDERVPKTKRGRWTDYWPFAVVLLYILIGLIGGVFSAQCHNQIELFE